MTSTRTGSPRPFDLGREAGDDGRFRRQISAFRDTDVVPVAGRYHLYVCAACPWAHRTIIVRRLKGLEGAKHGVVPISMSEVDPIRDERGWAFTGGRYTDPLHGFDFLSEAYAKTDKRFEGRWSVPVLWDKEEERIVNNESGDVVRLLDGAFGELASGPDLYPEALRPEIDALNERIYETVNNGVYMAGFATSQEAYEEAFVALFDTLDWLEERLSTRRYLTGDTITEADWRLFTTLLRFDAVYYVHFKCSKRRIVDYLNLTRLLRDLHGVPGVAETVDLDAIKRHYYLTHPMLNPSGIVPLGPALQL